MERAKKIAGGLLLVHPLLAALLGVLSGGALAWIFLTGRETSWMAYPVYVLSFYALMVVCIRLVPALIRSFRQQRQRSREKTPEDRELDFHKSLKSGLAVNLVYALFHMIMGWLSRSAWLGTQGAYQLVMALIHGVLLYYDRRRGHARTEKSRMYAGWQGFQTCGVLLLVLHLTMTGRVFLVIWSGETVSYPGVTIFAVAAYTFYKLTLALVRVVQYRKNASPLWGAARNIDLSEALMNLFTLQGALLAAFAAADQQTFRFVMNTLTGGGVCLLAVAGAVGMICHGKQRKIEFQGEA